jgi:hypothetical protein
MALRRCQLRATCENVTTINRLEVKSSYIDRETLQLMHSVRMKERSGVRNDLFHSNYMPLTTKSRT